MYVRFISLVLCLTSINIPAEKFEVDDVILDYEISGKGRTLLILHGGFGSKESMRSQIKHLNQNFEIIALDSREHGLSTASEKPISYERMYKDTLALIRHIKLKKLSVLGYSDGGVIGLMLASRNPQLIDKLVLIGTNYHWNAFSEKNRNDFLKMKASDMPDSIKGDFQKYRGTEDGFEEYIDEMKTMFLTSPTMTLNEMSNIESEVLIVAGDREAIEISHTVSLFRSIRGSALFIVPDAGHNAIYMKPKLVNSVISDFLIPK